MKPNKPKKSKKKKNYIHINIYHIEFLLFPPPPNLIDMYREISSPFENLTISFVLASSYLTLFLVSDNCVRCTYR